MSLLCTAPLGKSFNTRSLHLGGPTAECGLLTCLDILSSLFANVSASASDWACLRQVGTFWSHWLVLQVWLALLKGEALVSGLSSSVRNLHSTAAGAGLPLLFQ